MVLCADMCCAIYCHCCVLNKHFAKWLAMPALSLSYRQGAITQTQRATINTTDGRIEKLIGWEERQRERERRCARDSERVK